MIATSIARRRVGALVLLLAATLAVQGVIARPAHAAARQRQEMVSLTNRDRVERHRSRLALNLRLSRYAKRHSREMAERGYLFHTPNLSARLRGLRWSVGGENVGVGSSLPGLESAFMHSAPHRANILRKAFSHFAVGIVRAAGKFWVTVIFYG
ncbi:MAG TPA: CAP domain-containing protein [Actinomycetota bacterium]|nr:CAP domain-containing protein [Actinomycetota bacterium]